MQHGTSAKTLGLSPVLASMLVACATRNEPATGPRLSQLPPVVSTGDMNTRHSPTSADPAKVSILVDTRLSNQEVGQIVAFLRALTSDEVYRAPTLS